MDGLRRARQQGRPPGADAVAGAADVLARLQARAENSPMTPQRRRQLLGEIHLKLAEKEWVRLAYGDVTDQLAPVTG